MQALEILAEEHRLLRLALSCLERMVSEITLRDRLDCDSAARLLELLERFVDGCHQEKEERCLFPLLLRRAPLSSRDYVGKLIGDHTTERRHLGELRRHLEGASYGESTSLDLFVGHARKYLELQREHVAWEERLIPLLARQLLRAEEDAEAVEGFARVDARYGLEDALRSLPVLCRRFRVRTGASSAARPARLAG